MQSHDFSSIYRINSKISRDFFKEEEKNLIYNKDINNKNNYNDEEDNEKKNLMVDLKKKENLNNKKTDSNSYNEPYNENKERISPHKLTLKDDNDQKNQEEEREININDSEKIILSGNKDPVGKNIFFSNNEQSLSNEDKIKMELQNTSKHGYTEIISKLN